MSKRHLRVVHAALLLFVLPFAGHAADTHCPSLFQGGKAPDLVDTSLAERTTTLCYDAYSMDASGVRGGLLRQSIIDETVIDPFPSLSTSVKSHPIALPLPN
jgi:hypothetical protein